jgi:hypothetical protein
MGCQSKSIFDRQTVTSGSALTDKTSDQIGLALTGKAARTELKDTDNRIAKREKAVDNLSWGSTTDEAFYKKRATDLKTQRAALVESIDQLNAYEPNP